MKRLIAKLKSLPRITPGSKSTAHLPTPDIDPTPSVPESEAGPTKVQQESTPNQELVKEACYSGLESLPPEIRRHLLSVLDLPRLKALVHASPTFHQQYIFDRHYLLCESLERTLGFAAVDSYAVVQTRQPKRDVAKFFQWYSDEALRQRFTLFSKLTQEEALNIAGFYLHYIWPITQSFARWVLGGLPEASTQNFSEQRIELALTKSELMRLTRAIYRFQLLCQLSVIPKPNTGINIGQFQDSIILSLLECLQPWENEELFIFYQFACSIYDRVFTDIRWDLHPDNPRFDDQARPPTPSGAFEVDRNWENLREGTALHGLPLLQKVLFEIKDHQHLVSTMQQHLNSSYIPINEYEGVFGETDQEVRRRDNPSEKDLREKQREPFPFRGDGEPDAAPLAWTIIWEETYSNLYGMFIPNEMRRWGYVFWDAATIERIEGKKLLERQWEADHMGNDPRDRLFW